MMEWSCGMGQKMPRPGGNRRRGRSPICDHWHPASDASHHIELRYRLNQGSVETIPAAWLRNDLTNRAQYFEARHRSLSVLVTA